MDLLCCEKTSVHLTTSSSANNHKKQFKNDNTTFSSNNNNNNHKNFTKHEENSSRTKTIIRRDDFISNNNNDLIFDDDDDLNLYCCESEPNNKADIDPNLLNDDRVLENLMRTEENLPPSFLNKQDSINSAMRRMVAEWMLEVNSLMFLII